jgi:hypothetical protein
MRSSSPLISSLSAVAFSAALAAHGQPLLPSVASENQWHFPPYVKEFFSIASDLKPSAFDKLSLEQQIEIGLAANFAREPTTPRWLDAAVDHGQERVVQDLLDRLDKGRSRGTIDPLLFSMETVVERMPKSFRLSQRDLERCERAATRVPQLTRKPQLDALLGRLKARTAP